MHNSNFSSSNGSTEDLFRDSIDSCDNDITEKVGPGWVEKEGSQCVHAPGASGECSGLPSGTQTTLYPSRSWGRGDRHVGPSPSSSLNMTTPLMHCRGKVVAMNFSF